MAAFTDNDADCDGTITESDCDDNNPLAVDVTMILIVMVPKQFSIVMTTILAFSIAMSLIMIAI